MSPNIGHHNLLNFLVLELNQTELSQDVFGSFHPAVVDLDIKPHGEVHRDNKCDNHLQPVKELPLQAMVRHPEEAHSFPICQPSAMHNSSWFPQCYVPWKMTRPYSLHQLVTQLLVCRQGLHNLVWEGDQVRHKVNLLE